VLALAFSVLLTLYVIVPEAIFRFTFGIHIPTRSFTLTGTETAYRAVLVAFFPFWIALGLCWYVPGIQQWPFPIEQNSEQQRRSDYKLVSASLYNEAEFAKSQSTFWPALTRSARRQARLSIWYFLLVGLEGWMFGYLASQYARFKDNPLYNWLSDRIQSPYISQWHPLLLTSHLLPGTVVQADILCTNDVLYQGNVSEHFLKDGQLSGIILKQPRRFNRDLYLKAKDAGDKPEKKDYWIPIPSQHLYFFADKIINMNLSYITEKIASPAAVEQFLAEELRPLTDEFGKLTVSVGEAPMPLADDAKTKLSEAQAKPKKDK
jgi:hypothetical protein